MAWLAKIRQYPRVRWLYLTIAPLLATGSPGLWLVHRAHDPSRATQPFRVGFQHSPPQQYVTSDGKPTGPAIEIFTESCRRLHIPIVWVHSPDGPEPNLRSGKVDLWPLLGDLPERREFLHISDPWLATSYWMVTLESSPIRTPEDVAGRKLTHGSISLDTRIARANFKGAQLIPRANALAALDYVCRGESDAAVVAGSIGNTTLLREVTACKDRKLRFVLLPNGQIPLAIGASRVRPGAARAADAISAGIGSLAAAGNDFGRLSSRVRDNIRMASLTIDVCNPATSELLATVPDFDAADVDRAVASARASFEDKRWRGLDPSKRERILWNIGEALMKHRVDLSRIISQETGKTLREAAGADVAVAADCFRYYAGWVRKQYGETIPVDGSFLNYTLREPVGVVGAIVPWNFPLQSAAWKVAPALACGCSVVLKPSELTPLNALKFGEICTEAGLPEGVLNIVTGYGETAGEALSLHEGVDKISFTGSVSTARKLLANSSVSNLKRLSLELGGKSPNIVFPDADFDAAVKGALWGVFGNKGEMCTAASRLLLHEEIHDRFLDELVARARKLRLGDPLEPGSQMGPQISGRQMDRILDYIELGKCEGARLLTGGERDTEGEKAKGFFVKPTVFSEVTPDMRIAQEEIFGPVVCAMRFRDAAEAVRIANGTVYGLASAVWTRDIKLAHRMAGELKAGTVWVNSYNAFDSGSPFGGYKQSGFGRDLGSYALEQYTNIKSVWVAL